MLDRVKLFQISSFNFFSLKERVLFNYLSKIQYGRISIENHKSEHFVFTGLESGPDVQLKILNSRFYDQVVSKGDIGLAESYIQNDFECSHLDKLIEFAVLNKSALDKTFYGKMSYLFLYKLKHYFNSNTIKNSKKNIQFHYDLGNDFYRRWLDPSMTYSSALGIEQAVQNNELNFEDIKDERVIVNLLEKAQQAKYKYILDQLNIKPGEKILEIGCGWGGFAEMASQNGAFVTGLTLSIEQKKYAEQRALNGGWHSQFKCLLEDYRDHQGQYDHVVSIEMLEAVGEEFWGVYFQKIKSFVKPNGRVCIQSITISESSFEQYRVNTDFIQQYIFPGGMLPTNKHINYHISRISGNDLKSKMFGLDYAKTLAIWHDRFQRHVTDLKKENYSTEFIRTWEYYLKYCEGAFKSKQTDVGIFSFSL